MRLNAITVSKAVINQSRFIFPLQIETHFGSTFSPSLFSRILPTFHRQSRLNPRAESKPKKKKKKRKGRKTPLHRSHVHRESARKNLAKAFSREITFPLRRRRNATVPLRGIISRGIAARASRLATRRRRNLDRLARK